MDIFIEKEHHGLDQDAISQTLQQSLEGKQVSKVLLIPPDYTRFHSGCGLITGLYYKLLTSQGAKVDILPALGTHAPMSRKDQLTFFGDIPAERFLTHDWRGGVTTIGVIPASYVHEISEGLMDECIPVSVSNPLLDCSYDLILSLGQVVPHEVAGMANYSKNILVGCGGSNFINKSHMLGAYYGIEKILGRVDTPVRKLFDYAQVHFLSKLPLVYVLTVTHAVDDNVNIMGLYIGNSRTGFERAALLSQKLNITNVGYPIKTCIVWLGADEFHSTWLGNKAVYRTRMAMAEGGHLIILAPEVKTFGEDTKNDQLIRKYGYIGRERILSLSRANKDIQANLSVAAHLIHGSAEGRFIITYAAPLLGQKAIESVGYKYAKLDDMLKLYNPHALQPGYNTLKTGEEVYFINNPALGLWQYV